MVEIRLILNPTVDPCTDFAEHVSRFSSKMQAEMNLRPVRHILNNTESYRLISSEDAAGRRNLQKLRDFYASCMNETQIARLGRQPLLDEIKTIVNLFPVKDSPFGSLQDAIGLEVSGRPLMNATSGIFPEAFSEALGHLYKLGLYSFISLTTQRQTYDSGTAFVLYAGSMGSLSKPLYSVAVGQAEYEFGDRNDNSDVAKTLYLLMRPEDRSAFNSSGRPIFPSDGVPAVWSSTAGNIVFFENRLKDMTYGSRTVSLRDLSNMSDNINLTLALQKALPEDARLPSSITLHGNLMNFFDGVLESIKNFDPPPLQIQSYLVWTVVKQLIRQIDPKYGQFLLPYNDLQQERWKYCADVVDSTMGKMVAPFYARLLSKNYQTAVDMVDSIRNQLAEAYERAAGINNSTKARGLRKLNESLSFVGVYNVSITANSSGELEDFYRNLTIDRNDYFGNRKNYAMWYTANSLRGRNDFVLGDEQDMLPQNSHIGQNADGSKIKVPAGSLRQPLFHDGYPEYVNFGSIGAMIAQKYAQILDLGESSSLHDNHDFSACETSLSCQQRYCYYTLNRNLSHDYDDDYQQFPEELFSNSVGLQLAFDAWKRRSYSDRNGM
ncbi:hypothetical protein BGZ68_007585 [Mortierella alpina]|nr:hypothetical protein BGZ68_007585 [Mortierella alpina]